MSIRKKFLDQMPKLSALCAILVLSACSKTGNFFAEKCALDNPNCLGPGLEIISAGSKAVVSSGQMDPDGTTDEIAPHDVAYKKATETITLTITNPKLYPLLNFRALVTPAKEISGYSIVASTDAADCAVKLKLLYQDTCTVTVAYSFDGSTTPSTTSIDLIFDTPQGNPQIFAAHMAKPVILRDFSVESESPALKHTVAYVASPATSGETITAPLLLAYNAGSLDDPHKGILVVKNWSAEKITNMALYLNTLGNTTDGPFTIETDPDLAHTSCIGAVDLDPGASCYINLKFKPTSAGTLTTTLAFSGDDSIVHSYAITGTASNITPDVATVAFAVQEVSGAPVTSAVVFTTPSTTLDPAASLCTFTSSGADAANFVVSDTTAASCATINANTTCSQTITYTPSAIPAIHSANLDVACTSRGGNFSVPLSARTAITATLIPDITPTIDIGNVLLGTYAERTLTLNNTGTESPITGFARTLGVGTQGTFSITTDSCTTSLASGANCGVILRYAPGVSLIQGSAALAVAGTRVNAATDRSLALTVTGTGIKVLPSQASWAAGNTIVNTTTSGPIITITNPSTTQSTSGCTLTLSDTTNYSLSADGCTSASSLDWTTGTSLTTDPTCSYTLSYTPTTIASHPATVAYACVVGGTATVTLSGTGINDDRLVPTVPVAPVTTVDLGIRLVGITSHPTATFTFQNQNATLAITHVLATPSNIAAPWSKISNTCNDATLAAAGSTCTTVMQYDPTVVGVSGGTIAIASTDPLPADPTDPTYTATASTLTSATASYAFAAPVYQNQGATSSTITINNPSSADGASGCALALTGANAAAFSIIPDGTTPCGATMAASGSCAFSLALAAQGSVALLSANAVMTCTVGGVLTIPISANILTSPVLLEIEDNRTSTYANPLAASDVTGATNDANNIVDNTPTTRTITYTLRNTNVNGSSAAINTIVPTLSPVSGTAGTMSITTDNCFALLTLAVGGTCTLIVTYDPATANPEGSVYALAITATSASFGAGFSTAVTSITGNSIQGSILGITAGSSYDFGLRALSTPTMTSSNITIQNTGVHDAAPLNYSFTTNPSSVYAATVGTADADPACSASGAANLANPNKCHVKAQFTPGTTLGAFKGIVTASATSVGQSTTAIATGATYSYATAVSATLPIDEQLAGFEGDVAYDSTRFYIASRSQTGSGYIPVLTTCSRTATGALDRTACSYLNLDSYFVAGPGNLAGSAVGSGPRISLQNNLILIALENGDSSSKSVVIACDKPSGNNTVPRAGGSCIKKTINTSTGGAGNSAGIAPAIYSSSTKLIVANTYAVDTSLIITVCDLTLPNPPTTYVSAATIPSCVVTAIAATATKGNFPSIFADVSNNRLLIATQDRSSAEYSLRAYVCTFDYSSDTAPSACASSVVDTGAALSGKKYGYYTSIYLDATKVYLTHQREDASAETRLVACSLSAGTNTMGACETPLIVASGGTSGKYHYPSMAVGDNKIWVVNSIYQGTTGFGDLNDRYDIAVYKCEKSPISCTATPYFGTSNYGTGAPFAYKNMTRQSVLYDTTNKNLYIQYRSTAAGDDLSENGILQMGLVPEL